MKRKILVAFAIGFLLVVTIGTANATYIITDVSYTQNSVSFTIDGDMTGYGSSSYRQFSIEYFGNIFSTSSAFPNSWSTPVFDNEEFVNQGNTGHFSGKNYTWSTYTNTLADSIASSKMVTVSTGNFFDTTASGQMAFYWGHPFTGYVELARYDVVRGTVDSPVTNDNPVPEPSTILLLGFGLCGLAGVARKKMKK